MHRIGALLAAVGTTASLILTYDSWSDSAASLDARFGMGLLAGFAFLALVLLVWQEFRYARKTRAAEALPSLLRATQVSVGENLEDEAACRQALIEIVREASEIFSLSTGTRVSACIKVVKAEDAKGEWRFRVEDLCRDPKSQQRNGRRLSRPSKNWIDDNTDFRTLFDQAGKPQGDYYYCGWLPGEWDYRNTSFEVHGPPPKVTIPFLRDAVRDLRWPLPYKSTMIVPIRNIGVGAADTDPLVGFFCIDSRSRYVFSRRYDLPLLQLLAELAQPVLNQLIELNEVAQAHA